MKKSFKTDRLWQKNVKVTKEDGREKTGRAGGGDRFDKNIKKKAKEKEQNGTDRGEDRERGRRAASWRTPL